MLRVDPQTKQLTPLGRRTLQPVSVLRRYSLASLIAGNPSDFFLDLGLPIQFMAPDLVLPSGRPAALATDSDGRVYVVAAQSHGRNLDLIEPLEDASQVARWSGPELLRRLPNERANAIRAFLRAPVEKLNQEQGALLVGESFDTETLAAAGWLRRRYNVSILCFRARMAVDSLTGHEFLAFRDLADEVERVYLQNKSDEEDGAPWPTIHPDPEASSAAEPEPQENAAQALQADVVEALVEDPIEAVLTESDPEIRTDDDELDPAPGDPLDDILGQQSLMPAPLAQEPVEAEDGSERRIADRREDLQARRLRLDYFGKLLGARLVDFSTKGIGVEALTPLPIGAEVGISGELIGRDGSMGLDGRVKVKHCSTGEDGVSRIGLELDKSALRLIEDQEFFDRR